MLYIFSLKFEHQLENPIMIEAIIISLKNIISQENDNDE